MKKTQISITLGAIGVGVIHIIWPNLNIDAISLSLIILAVIPWLAPLFRSMELPGGIKFEFQELERVQKEAKAVGLVSDQPTKNKYKYPFLEIAETYPQLALASLRIELEKSLKALAMKTKVACSECVNHKGHGVSSLTRDLFHKGVISAQEKAVLEDMIGTLNRAVHDEELDIRAAQWVIDIGPKILDSINSK